MRAYSLAHLSDSTLLHDLASLVAKDRSTTAALLAHIAEFDARKLYLPAGYSSTFAYCVEALHLSEDAAYKRIAAARAARQFPILFETLAEGCLTLSAVVMLAPHLTRDNARGLLAAAAGKRKAEIEELLAARFPRPELAARVRALSDSTSQPDLLLASRRVDGLSDSVSLAGGELAPGRAASLDQLAPGRVVNNGARGDRAMPAGVTAALDSSVRRARTTPVSSNRFALQLTMERVTHDKLRYAQALISHCVKLGDLGAVLDRALDALIAELERRKFAASSKPRPSRRATSNPRVIPAHVRRAVWQRDQGRCTFVGADGHRCGSRTRLEFDHIDPVARGGRATAAGLRLRCRAHNQYEAERIFGTGFMNAKREQAREAAAAAGHRGVGR